MLEPPFTGEEFLQAADGLFNQQPENRPQVRSKPRASGIASCAKQQAYYMANVDEDNAGEPSEKPDMALTQEQGRMFEGLSAMVMGAMGFRLRGRQVCIGHEVCPTQPAHPKRVQGPIDYPVTGHPDGQLAQILGVDNEPEHGGGEVTVDQLAGNLKWGFEHKHLGRWAYEHVFKFGIDEAEPEHVAQVAMYGDALGWDACLEMIIAQDASSTRSDARINLGVKDKTKAWAHREGWDPKIQLVTHDIHRLQRMLVPALHRRAQWLSKIRAEDVDPGRVVREFDPTDTRLRWQNNDGVVEQVEEPEFPCSYCPYLQRCLDDGPGDLYAPTTPWMRAMS